MPMSRKRASSRVTGRARDGERRSRVEDARCSPSSRSCRRTWDSLVASRVVAIVGLPSLRKRVYHVLEHSGWPWSTSRAAASAGTRGPCPHCSVHLGLAGKARVLGEMQWHRGPLPPTATSNTTVDHARYVPKPPPPHGLLTRAPCRPSRPPNVALPPVGGDREREHGQLVGALLGLGADDTVPVPRPIRMAALASKQLIRARSHAASSSHCLYCSE